MGASGWVPEGGGVERRYSVEALLSPGGVAWAVSQATVLSFPGD